MFICLTVFLRTSYYFSKLNDFELGKTKYLRSFLQLFLNYVVNDKYNSSRKRSSLLSLEPGTRNGNVVCHLQDCCQGRKSSSSGQIKMPRAPGWLSQLGIELLISAQVMISRFVGLSPVSGSLLMVQSLLGTLSLPLSFSLSLSLPLPPPLLHSLSLKINKLKKNNFV